MNNVILVGRLAGNPEVKEIEDGKKVTTVSLAVSRNFKNSEGIYETDFIRCILWNGIAENTSEYCKSGDVVGIKGRLQSSYYDDENDKRHFITDVVAERVTFLSSKSKDEIEQINQESEEKIIEKSKIVKNDSKSKKKAE